MEWLPIESAPSGERVLVSDGVVVDCARTPAALHPHWLCGIEGRSWTPSHWMPLPDPPQS